MGKFKVVYTDNIYKDNEIEFRRFKELGYDFTVLPAHDEETLIKECRDADGIMVSYADMNERVINTLEKCKIIVRCGIGFNNVDVAAASKRGIMVANVLKYCLDEVSDHALALALTLVRRTAYMTSLVRSGVWDPVKARPIPRLSELTFGVYGLGAISSKAAKKAQAFNMRVIGYDPYLPAERFAQMGVEHIANEADLFKQSDILSLHIPLNKDTAGIISYDKMKLMKPSAIIVNTARGGIIDEPGLIKALQEGVIGGAGLDVLTEEYPSMSNPLFQMPNVVITPHIAYYSEGSDVDLRNFSIDQIYKALEEGAPEFFVNKKELGR